MNTENENKDDGKKLHSLTLARGSVNYAMRALFNPGWLEKHPKHLKMNRYAGALLETLQDKFDDDQPHAAPIRVCSACKAQSLAGDMLTDDQVAENKAWLKAESTFDVVEGERDAMKAALEWYSNNGGEGPSGYASRLFAALGMGDEG